MRTGPLRWHVHADRFELERHVREAIVERAARSIDARGSFSIVLSGGTTPRGLYAAMATLSEPRWEHWNVYFADERCLPVSDAARNDALARALWLERVGIPRTQVFTIPAELGAEAGALAYRGSLRGIGPFDLVLLGLGEDGHTASLFPGRPIGDDHDAPDALAVSSAPKPPAERVSLSAARLSRSAAVFLLVAGARKRAAVAALRAGENDVLARIRPPNGIDVHVDRAAAG